MLDIYFYEKKLKMLLIDNFFFCCEIGFMVFLAA